MTTNKEQASILLIYTGGTIGMIENAETGVLEAFNFQHLAENVPELKKLGHKVDTYQFDPPLESLPIITPNTMDLWYYTGRTRCHTPLRH